MPVGFVSVSIVVRMNSLLVMGKYMSPGRGGGVGAW